MQMKATLFRSPLSASQRRTRGPVGGLLPRSDHRTGQEAAVTSVFVLNVPIRLAPLAQVKRQERTHVQ
jgi:hypothetical protein